MSNDYCYGFLCFVPLDATAPKFFGFSEFLAGLALMVLAWTIADARYRFRVRTAPLPLQGITFAMVCTVGILTLLTDLWRAEQWLVPRGRFVTPSAWQGILGGLFLLTFLTWAWFAFIRPPVYGKGNAKRYARTLYRAILKGSPSELAVIADEFSYSARSLIRHATERGHRRETEEGETPSKKPPTVTAYANDILLLIADKRFCRAVVESSPGTALAVFHEIGEMKKYGIRIGIFAKNIVNEALANRDSFLFHEAEGYESGLIGYHKPLSQAMFSNYQMAEVIGTLLDPDLLDKRKWDAAQWKAYCRVVLMTFRDYVEQGHGGHSYVLYRAKGYIEHAASDLYKLDGITNSAWDDDVRERLRVVVEFITEAIDILDKKDVPKYVQLRVREDRLVETFYDHLASMMVEVIFLASTVRSPADLCWWIQHNTVWHELFNFNRNDGPAGKVVKFKARRLIYDEVARMKSLPNFKGARILGFCLNVMGLTVYALDSFDDSKALQKAILSWTKKNYAWLSNPNRAERERAMCRAFLRCLGVTFAEAEIVAPAPEPVDVSFRDARFQVRDHRASGAQPHAEWKARLARATQARSMNDAIGPWPRVPEWSGTTPMSFGELTVATTEALEKKARKYGKACGTLDALVYADVTWTRSLRLDTEPGDTTRLVEQGWRSVSVLFPMIGLVLCARAEAPGFLRRSPGPPCIAGLIRTPCSTLGLVQRGLIPPAYVEHLRRRAATAVRLFSGGRCICCGSGVRARSRSGKSHIVRYDLGGTGFSLGPLAASLRRATIEEAQQEEAA